MSRSNVRFCGPPLPPVVTFLRNQARSLAEAVGSGLLASRLGFLRVWLILTDTLNGFDTELDKPIARSDGMHRARAAARQSLRRVSPHLWTPRHLSLIHRAPDG
jgi:hypothetical protein